MTVHRAALAGVVLALIAAACGGSDGASYAEEIEPLLRRASDADAAWSQASAATADADFSTLSADAITDLMEAELDATREGMVVHREVGDAMGTIVPPEECEDVHANYVESLRLGERAFLELQLYGELFLRTGDSDDDLLASANELLAEVNRVKQEGVVLEARSDCF